MIYKSIYNSPLGDITIASNEDYLLGAWFEEQKYFGAVYLDNASSNDNDIIIKTKEWFDDYFNNKKPEITKLPLQPEGTPFREIVWQVLCDIPYGQTKTYKEISQEVAKILNKESMSAQAIGGAVGHNPISIIIPCHRVVGSDKSLTGYAGGLDRKIALLELENIKLD